LAKLDLQAIDARAASLGLTRSAYLLALARRDLVEKAAFLLVPQADPPNNEPH